MNRFKDYTKEELINFKNEIDERLKILEIEKFKQSSGSLSDISKDSKVFCIKLYLGGHRLEEPSELVGKIDVVDDCTLYVIECDGDEIYFNISHPTKLCGLGTRVSKEYYENEHCYLHIDTRKTGYNAFYTIKIESWKEDLTKKFQQFVERKNKSFQDEFLLLDNKFDMFLTASDKIKQYI